MAIVLGPKTKFQRRRFAWWSWRPVRCLTSRRVPRRPAARLPALPARRRGLLPATDCRRSAVVGSSNKTPALVCEADRNASGAVGAAMSIVPEIAREKKRGATDACVAPASDHQRASAGLRLAPVAVCARAGTSSRLRVLSWAASASLLGRSGCARVVSLACHLPCLRVCVCAAPRPGGLRSLVLRPTRTVQVAPARLPPHQPARLCTGVDLLVLRSTLQ